MEDTGELLIQNYWKISLGRESVKDPTWMEQKFFE